MNQDFFYLSVRSLAISEMYQDLRLVYSYKTVMTRLCFHDSHDSSGGTRIFFLWGASRGQNPFLRGQKSKNLLKMADIDHLFLLRGEEEVGAEPPTGGGRGKTGVANSPHDAATA